MTAEEVRARVAVHKTEKGMRWTTENHQVGDLFEDVLRAIAHGSMSYGNAKALAAEALRVLDV